MLVNGKLKVLIVRGVYDTNTVLFSRNEQKFAVFATLSEFVFSVNKAIVWNLLFDILFGP